MVLVPLWFWLSCTWLAISRIMIPSLCVVLTQDCGLPTGSSVIFLPLIILVFVAGAVVVLQWWDVVGLGLDGCLLLILWSW